MTTIRRFEDIQAWQKARALIHEVYRICAKAPLRQDYGLEDQLCRNAVSSMSNIAEGFARKTDRDFAHFLDVAKGSAIETQSLLYVALDVGYLEADGIRKICEIAEETASLIGGLISYLRALSYTPDPGLKDSKLFLTRIRPLAFATPVAEFGPSPSFVLGLH